MKVTLIRLAFFVAFGVLAVMAMFGPRHTIDMVYDAAHEIRTADAFKQSAMGGAGSFVNPSYAAMPVAATVPVQAAAPPILSSDVKPQLIKEFGIEVVPVGAQKLRVTGVMGASWGQKGGLKRGDVLLRFNKKSINGLKDLKTRIAAVKSEKSYRVRVMRAGKIKKLKVTVGEGEMEGFTPIVPVAFAVAAPMRGLFQCPGCTGQLFADTYGQAGIPSCPSCNLRMNRIR